MGRSAMEKFAPVKRSEDGQPVRYLIVDDSVFARKNLARMVETFGGQVIGEAGDGVSAISEYERLTPDIVLMDITMPQMEGIEAAEKIVRDHPSARIVMVSSGGYQENIVAALQRGARHFVQKPVKPEVLYEVIKYVMRDDGTTARAAGAGTKSMRMDLIQPFINSADAVLAQALESPISIENLSMEEEAYRRHGTAAEVSLQGEIEGRIIFDVELGTAVQLASRLAGVAVSETDEALVREAVCELANQIIGNAVTTLNDEGFHFHVLPPTVLTSDQGGKSSEDTEALVLCFSTSSGKVFMNVAL